MYENQVKLLRYCANTDCTECAVAGCPGPQAYLSVAADIIEELSKMPIPVRPFFLSCNCEEKYERTDCVHYDEEQDMGAHIPFCRLYKRSGYCPCLGCEKYERRVKLPESQKEENK